MPGESTVVIRRAAGGGSDIAVGITESAIGGSGCTTSGVTTAASGSLFLVGCSCPNGATLSTPTDSKSNTYNPVTTETDFFGRNHRVWQATNGTGGASHTFTCNCSSGATDCFVIEFTNAATASAIDTQNTASDSSSPYTVSGTTSNANDGLASFMWHDASSGTCSHSESSGFTVQDQITNSTTDWPGASATRIVSSTSTYTPSWTVATCTGTANAVVKIIAVKD
jgi:hypothetical protein